MYSNFIFDIAFISLSGLFYFFFLFVPNGIFSGITMEKSFPLLALTLILLVYKTHLKYLKEKFQDKDFIYDWTDVLFHQKILSKVFHRGQYILIFILFCFIYLFLEMLLFQTVKFSPFAWFWLFKIFLYSLILFSLFYPLYKLFADLEKELKKGAKKHKFTSSNFLNFDPLGEFIEEPRVDSTEKKVEEKIVSSSDTKFVLYLSLNASILGIIPLFLLFNKIAKWPLHLGIISYLIYLFLVFFPLKSLLIISKHSKEEFSLLMSILAPLGMGILYFY